MMKTAFGGLWAFIWHEACTLLLLGGLSDYSIRSSTSANGQVFTFRRLYPGSTYICT